MHPSTPYLLLKPNRVKVIASGGSSPTFKFVDTGAATTGTTVTWTVGGGHTVSAGDLVLLFAILGDPSTTFADPGNVTPTGFTDLLELYDGAHTGAEAYVGWKTAAGGETSFVSQTMSRNVQGEWAIVVYSGANVSPIDGNSSALAASASTNMTAASISPAGSTDTLIAFAYASGGGMSGVTNFSGMTSRVDTGGSGGFANQTQIYVAEQTLAASGATGTRVATATPSEFYFSGLIGLKT